MTTAPATTMHAPSRTVGERRLSRLALFGALCFPISLLIAFLPLMFVSFSMAAARPEWQGMALPVAWTHLFTTIPIAGLAGVVGLTGVILSISGWVAIGRSGGRLHGLWLAVPGTILPFLCGGPLLALAPLFLARTGSFASTML